MNDEQDGVEPAAEVDAEKAEEWLDERVDADTVAQAAYQGMDIGREEERQRVRDLILDVYEEMYRETAGEIDHELVHKFKNKLRRRVDEAEEHGADSAVGDVASSEEAAPRPGGVSSAADADPSPPGEQTGVREGVECVDHPGHENRFCWECADEIRRSGYERMRKEIQEVRKIVRAKYVDGNTATAQEESSMWNEFWRRFDEHMDGDGQ